MAVVVVASAVVSVLALVLSIVVVLGTASSRSVARSQERALLAARRTEAEAEVLLAKLNYLNSDRLQPRAAFVPAAELAWARDSDLLRVLSSLNSAQLARLGARSTSAEYTTVVSKSLHVQWAADVVEHSVAASKSSWAKSPRSSQKDADFWHVADSTGALPAAV